MHRFGACHCVGCDRLEMCPRWRQVHTLARAIADEAAAAREGDGGEPHACYVISHSIAKRQNLGTLARSCTAFNVKEVRCRVFRNPTCNDVGR
jgi:tRNA G18 (ribose-2'-O)-methylase SpoU